MDPPLHHNLKVGDVVVPRLGSRPQSAPSAGIVVHIRGQTVAGAVYEVLVDGGIEAFTESALIDYTQLKAYEKKRFFAFMHGS